MTTFSVTQTAAGAVVIVEARCTGPQCRAFIGTIQDSRTVKLHTRQNHILFIAGDIAVECHRCGHSNTAAAMLARACT